VQLLASGFAGDWHIEWQVGRRQWLAVGFEQLPAWRLQSLDFPNPLI
jgi:hypothetical protein